MKKAIVICSVFMQVDLRRYGMSANETTIFVQVTISKRKTIEVHCNNNVSLRNHYLVFFFQENGILIICPSPIYF